MAIVVAALGVFVAAMGGVGLAAPRALIALAERMQTRGRLYLAAAVRLGFGAALWFAAPNSKAPMVLRVLGVLVAAAGVSIPVIGVERCRRFLAWWTARRTAFVRCWAGFAVLFGAFLVYCVLA